MAFPGSGLATDVGLRLLLSPVTGSNLVMKTACCGVGICIPVYSTIKAIERKDENEQHKWLVYWAAYGSLSLVEVFADKFVSWYLSEYFSETNGSIVKKLLYLLFRFPMYYQMKLAFLVWLQLPSIQGAKQIYQNHIRPFFLKHQARADHVLGVVYNELAKLISKHQSGIQFIKTSIMKLKGSADHGSRTDTTGEPEKPQGPNATRAPTKNLNSGSDDHEE
ncbi:hypothetical protein ACFE04_001675 [Oxalis oulophora]